MTIAKRKLSNFNFEAEGAHIALVHKDQGGPANGVDYALITKATKDITVKDVEKASEVTVTLNIVDFLRKFFDLWYDDALVLAAVMGYDVSDVGYDYELAQADSWINKRIDAIEIMKSVTLDVDDIGVAVSQLSPKDYASVLKVQEVFEKNFDAATSKVEAIKKSSGIPAKGVTTSKGVNTTSVEINNKEEDSMSEFISKAAHEEQVNKAVDEAIAKAVAPVQEELQKAKQQLEVIEKAQVEAVTKARQEAVASVEKDADKAAELFKSLEALPDEAFDTVIKALAAKDAVVEDSDLFVQKSKSLDEEVEEENGTAALLKAKFAK
jgi:hypothetical protein